MNDKNETYTDRLLARIRNNKILSIFIVAGIVLIGIGAVFGAMSKIRDFVEPTSDTETCKAFTNLQFNFAQNKRVFNELTQELDIDHLEYAPDYIHQRINELPIDSPARDRWLSRIHTIIDNNDKSIVLLDNIEKTAINPLLNEKLGDFVYHAQGFNDTWRSIISTNVPPIGRDPTNVNLYSDRYPADLDDLILNEINAACEVSH